MHSLDAYTKTIIHSEILKRQGHMDGDAMPVPKFQIGQPSTVHVPVLSASTLN